MTSLFNFIVKVCNYLRINEDGKLSLTNIALSVILFKLVFAQNVDYAHMATLAIALMSYQGKRLINSYFEPTEPTIPVTPDSYDISSGK